MAPDLVQFLRERLDEDERTAREAASAERADTWASLPDSHGGVLDGAGIRSLVVGYGDVMAPETATHIARHDPARVLREVEAKRAVVELHVCPCPYECGECGACSGPHEGDPTPAPCDTLRHLAAVYADHPDYREEWRPDDR